MALNKLYKYEWLGLVRDRWIILLSLILSMVCFYAAHNGKEKLAERQAPLMKAYEEVKTSDAMFIALIDSVDQGLKPGLPVWQNPQRLNVIGQRAARVCAFDALPLAVVATGQSDLFTHQVKPRLYGEALTLGFSELSNPVQLLFGNFDLAFVSIYLLSLLVLAFSYNVLSSEKESGTMRLTFVQPVTPAHWLLQKLTVRFIILSAVFIIAFMVSLTVAGVSVAAEIKSVLKLILAVLAYMLFWFALSFWVNLRGKSSGNNAVVLVSLWVLIVLLIPAMISQLVSSLYPVPSRVGMLTELRKAEAEAQQQADEILAAYYRDHPELAQTDAHESSLYPYWLSYFASQEVIRKAVEPVQTDYESKLSAQQRTVDQLRFFSPAVLLQNSFNEIAGSSSRHYTAYRQQVVAFAGTWRDFFVPRMFKNERMRKEMFSELPQFSYDAGKVEQQFIADLTGLVLFAAGVFGWSFLVYRHQSMERILAV